MKLRINNIFNKFYVNQIYKHNAGTNIYKQENNPLTHKTFERLLSTQSTPSLERPADSFSTHVIDKMTGEPVEVFVQLSDKYRLQSERYVFLVRDNTVKTHFTEIGERSFEIDKELNKITPGSMKNRNRSRYAGIGIRGHQIAIEKMIENNLSNVEIVSLTKAYPFHKGCGFEAFSDSFISLERKDINDILQSWSDRFCIDKKELKQFLKIRKVKKNYILDRDLTLSNIAEYYIRNGLILPETSAISMRLSNNAIEAWKNFIDKQPIILGK